MSEPMKKTPKPKLTGQRKRGFPADYRGATPEQVARSMRLPRPKSEGRND